MNHTSTNFADTSTVQNRHVSGPRCARMAKVVATARTAAYIAAAAPIPGTVVAAPPTDNRVGSNHHMQEGFVSLAVAIRRAIRRLSRILGHTSISTTQVYLRSMGLEHLQEGHAKYSPLGRLA